MDVVAILGFVLTIIAILGAVLPLLPGPALGFAGILVMHYSRPYEFSTWMLVLCGSATLITFFTEYLLPAWSAKKFGGTKYGMWGATVGMLLGAFVLPVIGIIAGPVIGAIIGELIHDNDTGKAMKAAWGSLIGFFLSTGVKLLVALLMFFLALGKVMKWW